MIKYDEEKVIKWCTIWSPDEFLNIAIKQTYPFGWQSFSLFSGIIYCIIVVPLAIFFSKQWGLIFIKEFWADDHDLDWVVFDCKFDFGIKKKKILLLMK